MEFNFSADLFGQPIWAYYMAAAALMAPSVRIFLRAGFNPAWALLLLVPYVGYIACAGVLALRPWPKAHLGPHAAIPGEFQP